MATLIDKLAHLEGIEHLAKVDPNTQDSAEQSNDRLLKLERAVIPAVLAGFYKFSRNEQNASRITAKHAMTDWVQILFGEDKEKLLQKIADYAGTTPKVAERKMQGAAKNAVNIVREDLPEPDGKNIKKYFTDERNTILQHLPADIEIGNILNDTTLDDRTNKMSGPVSGLMHTIEKTFASTDTEKPQQLAGEK